MKLMKYSYIKVKALKKGDPEGYIAELCLNGKVALTYDVKFAMLFEMATAKYIVKEVKMEEYKFSLVSY